MSYYTGFSLREVYRKRCVDLQCSANSAVLATLSDVPDDFLSLTSLDLSRNFLGTKGVIPLLDVVECATALRSLDLRHQELGNEAVAIICARLRRHPSLQKLNMSDNPITLAVGTELLELAKNNAVLQYIHLDRTLVRPSMVTVIEVQLEKNRQHSDSVGTVANTTFSKAFPTPAPSAALAAPSSAAATAYHTQDPDSPHSAESGSLSATTPAGGGAAAAAALSRRPPPPPRSDATPRRRCPAHELQHVLRDYTRTVMDVLFEADPTSDLWEWCQSHHYFFDDALFSSRHDERHRTARHTYGIAGWRRVGELFPKATLFGSGSVSHLHVAAGSGEQAGSDEHHATALSAAAASGLLPEANSILLQLPSDVPEGFTWTFTALMASVKDVQSLKSLFCCGRPSPASAVSGSSSSSPRWEAQQGADTPGIFVMRLHVEGEWRYLIVDDFLPVDKFGRLIFTKPSLNDTAFWPCILEKMMAKLYGGYHAIDSHFDDHHAGIDGPLIRKPIAWKYLSRENLRRATDAATPAGALAEDNSGSDPASVVLSHLAGSSGRAMARFTGGFYDSHRLHPIRESAVGRWWDLLMKALTPPRTARSGASFTRSGSAGRHAAGGVTSAKHSTLGGPGRASGRFSSAAHSTMAGAMHTGVVAFSRDADHTVNGIHASTAYQVMRVCHVNGVRLLMLRNPWCGTQKWSGDWADDSPLWKKNPEVADMLLQRTSTFAGTGESLRGLSEATAYARGDSSVLTLQSNLKQSLLSAMRSSVGGTANTAAPSTAHSAASSSRAEVTPVVKSTFWMAYTDFLKNFEWVHFCRVFGDDFYRRDFHGEWSCDNAGGNAREPTWHTNPHYRLVLPHRTTVRLQLTRSDISFHRHGAGRHSATERGEGGVGLQVVRDAYYPLHCPPLGPLDGEGAPYVVAGCATDAAVGGASGGGGGNSGKAVAPYSFSTLLYSAMEQVGDYLTAELTLDAGAQYWIVPTTYAPRILDRYQLSVVGTAAFQVQEAAESQYWDTRTTAPETLNASSSPQVSQSDGELAILFNARARVLRDAVALFLDSDSHKRAAQHGLGHLSSGGAGKAVVGQPFLPSRSPPAQPPSGAAPCRVVVTATMEVVECDAEMDDFGFEDGYAEHVRCDGSGEQGPSVILALVPGEVDTEGQPSRTIGEIDPHPATVFAVGPQHTVLEAEIAPVAEHEVEYYTAICSPQPLGTQARVSYQVWCAAPLLEVRSLPEWAKQEIAVGWDEQHGSGTFYDCAGHPQIELTNLQPYQRFTVALRMTDYDTITPAIMFSVIRSAQHTGEPVTGRIAEHELFARSEYVDEAEVQTSFELDGAVPGALLIIPCLQPTGSRGRCVVTISSDSDRCRARPLSGVSWQES